jgi:transcriptional regulator with XRE-family HTH domain
MSTSKKPAAAAAPDPDKLDDAHLGAEIRKLRKARGLSLTDVAGVIGRSISFISQLERGRASPSIADLKGIAKVLGVPLGWFFTHDQVPAAERGKVVRSSGRRRLGTVTSGLVEELLSPDIGGAFEMFLSIFEPGAELKSFSQRHRGGGLRRGGQPGDLDRAAALHRERRRQLPDRA